MLVMAAGMGSRYGGIKQLDSVGICGETILEFGLFDACNAGFDEVVFIIRQEIESDFRRLITDRIKLPIPVKLAFQETALLPAPWDTAPETKSRTKPWGTAHAVWCAKDFIDCPFAVINADDFYGRRSFELVHDWLATCDSQAPEWVMAGYQLRNTLSENGSVSRGICTIASDGKLQSIEEHTTLVGSTGTSNSSGPISQVISTLSDGSSVTFSPETIVSMNMFGFTPGFFGQIDRRLSTFLQTRGTEAKSEFYLPSVVTAALADGSATMKVLTTPESWFGVTYKEDRAMVMERIRGLIGQGIYPQNLWGVS